MALTVLDARPSADAKIVLPDLPQPCQQYASYKGGKRISEHEAGVILLYSGQPPRAALVTHPYGASPSPGDLIVVNLSTGSSKVIATGVTSIMRLGTDDTRVLAISGKAKALSVHPLGGGQSTSLGTNSCRVFPARDGARVYFLSDCTTHTMPEIGTHIGTLRVAEVKTGAVTTITKEAAAAGLGLSKDGTRAAFLTKMVQGLYKELGTLVEWREGKGIQTIADKVGFKYRLHYLSSDHLLYHQWESGSTYKLMRHDPTTGKTTKLSQDRVYYGSEHIWYAYEHSFELSADEKHVIGSPPNAPSGPELNLYAVRLDGGGQKKIASDLYGGGSSGPMWTWRFTPDGKHLIYLSQKTTGDKVQSAFKAMTWPGLVSTVLFEGWGNILEVENLTREVLYYQFKTYQTLRLASLVTGKSRTLFSGSPTYHPMVRARLPRGRGFLIRLESMKKAVDSQLSVVSLSGKVTHFGQGRFLYVGSVESTGCAFAFSRSQGPMPGTYVAQVP